MKTKQEAHKPHIVPPTFFQPSIVIPPSLLQQWNNNNIRTKKKHKNSHSSIHLPFNLLHLLHLTCFNNIERTNETNMNTKQEAQKPHIVWFIFTSTFYICSIITCLKNETKVKEKIKSNLKAKQETQKPQLFFMQ
jgi:hypothetical protein